MSAIRAFIAVEIPAELRQQIAQLERDLQQRSGDGARRAVRWVAAENMHLTLKFLGDVSTSSVEGIARMLRSEAARCKPFAIRVHGLGCFPNARRPRVLWTGVDAPQTLFALQRTIEGGAHQLGYPLEERPFSPHLTLGRVAQNATPADVARLAQALEGLTVGELGRMQVDCVHLYQSDLQPGGAVYTSLYCAALGGDG